MKASLGCTLLWLGLAVAASSYEEEFMSQALRSKRGQLLIRDDSDDGKCSKKKPCKSGCCGPLDDTGVGICGTGPKFCGKGCTSSCDYKSECDPGWGMQWSNSSKCPLNVCCSQYGFCGTTDQYCQGKVVSVPQCDPNKNSSHARTIGYYEGWNWQRPCGTMKPSQIPIGYYSHVYFAFSLANPHTFRLEPMDSKTGTLYDGVAELKMRQPSLEVWIAVGGWAMNDPGPHRTTFSDIAKSEKAQDEFFESLITFMMANNYDGVDIDWEYPVADDRGGTEADFKNYVTMIKRLRQRLNQLGVPKGLSITLPASYWYLRGFDIINLEPHVDFFNVMTYDIHGVWDANIPSLGPYAHAHTNLTEIEEALKLLWRNNINPERVNLGLGFYGRSFTMKDPGCMAAGCEYKSAGKGGNCTGTPGVLSAHEITQIIKGGAKVTRDNAAAVEIVTWDKNQWVSWDSTETLAMKVKYANERCLGGVMVWAIDLDDGTLINSLADTGRPTYDYISNLPWMTGCFGSELPDWAFLNDTDTDD
ncbi:glycoside hydrolase family 18 protein [Thermothielavioides terrestris NRRL 8126]|uniref:chitinase n=1 Tax=Thermothielavioides terrestris (strain ATCC 38088 / NRRL 8126) TaxID=578455 RepID=G2R9D6_THETT|nr:glycoside hydrolase family 18 protein [Thermothielavioides terrestris NRRL 8126]AEO68677.1 glycoside hydrolase family 18 protein [Thermothielavioides terrestris NRRL 8126]